MSLDVIDCVAVGKMSTAIRSFEDLRKLDSGNNDYVPQGQETGENVIIINKQPHVFIGGRRILLETLSRDYSGSPQINHFLISHLKYDSSGRLTGEVFVEPCVYGKRFDNLSLASHYEDLLNNLGIGGMVA